MVIPPPMGPNLLPIKNCIIEITGSAHEPEHSSALSSSSR